jgi:hypothetical protein
MSAGHVSAEAHFVTTAVREDAQVADLRTTLGAIDDWDRVAALARTNGIAALILRGCATLGANLPADVEDALRDVMAEGIARVLVLDAELSRLAPSLVTAAGPTMVLKGWAVARTIYPDPALRPYGDIDLLLSEERAGRGASALLAAGLIERPYAAETARQRRAPHAEASFHRLFTDPAQRVLVELHTDAFQIGIRPRCEADRWERALPLPGLSGVSMLCPEDQLLQLSVHLHRHGLNRLIWLKDLDLLMRARELDWELISHDSRREGVNGSVWLALTTASRLLGTPLPTPARRLAPSLPVRALYRWVWPETRSADLRATMRRRGVQFHAAESLRGMLPSLVLMGRRGHRLRAIARRLLRR